MLAFNDIWLADLAKCLITLQPKDDQAHKTISNILGFDFLNLPDTLSSTKNNQEFKAPQNENSAEKEMVKNASSKPEPPIKPSPSQPGEITQSEMAEDDEITYEQSPANPLQSIPSDILSTIRPLPKVDLQKYCSTKSPFYPLFNPKWQKGILTALISTHEEIGLVDISHLLEVATNCKPIQKVPRTFRWTTFRGAQLAIDMSESMEPFRTDQANAKDLLKTIIGKSQLDIITFYGSPLRGVYRSDYGNREQYKMPAPKTPIVLISDLGHGNNTLFLDTAPISEWLSFAEVAKRRGCPIVVLTPYPQQRWHTVLSDKFNMFYWDRKNTFAKARHKRITCCP